MRLSHCKLSRTSPHPSQGQRRNVHKRTVEVKSCEMCLCGESQRPHRSHKGSDGDFGGHELRSRAVPVKADSSGNQCGTPKPAGEVAFSTKPILPERGRSLQMWPVAGWRSGRSTIQLPSFWITSAKKLSKLAQTATQPIYIPPQV